MNIAFAYNVKVNDPSADLIKQTDIEFDLPVVIDAIEKTLQELGHSVIKIEANLEAYEKLKENKDKIDIVFNIA
jgi:CheY-like chemotaxis protein